MEEQYFITTDELEKATQKVLNSLKDKPRSYAESKMILNNAINKLSLMCFFKK